ncbi:Phospholipase/Carboxylesterase-domain-containing protein [Phaeosphaeriaceae sp. PMI808]|nr:Phospholipase/Carboxylesterase-domain-containing protein [Phaeosphaeriaceae sp. PMI808]
MLPERKAPIIITPTAPPTDASESAAFIFIHGLGEEAEGVENVARQFQAASKLPYLTWVLPNAMENHDLATTAWCLPTRPSPYPPSRPELEDDEDEEGMLATVAYLTTLIDDLVKQGIPSSRIVLGGFSQGHTMCLLTGLVSKYAGQLGGLVGLSGYLPTPDRIRRNGACNGGRRVERFVYLARASCAFARMNDIHEILLK